MLEYLANPPWWVVAIITLAVPEAFRRIKQELPSWMDHAKGALRRRLRSWRRNQLLVIKGQRFDIAAINRLIARSYAFLVLFVTCALVYGIGLLLIPESMRQTEQGVMFWGISTGLPMLAFELAWLRASVRVDEILKYRKKIKPFGRRLR
ncbi:hypothetical protein [Stutzerimonas balearica]|uniref:hypothetical protein n=1 Tax=Stutzerimonas balearica TaxID=74829 RepID=UPI0028AFECEF|nr:hypothetical protein [Stutzerimonas balearica]